MDKTAESLADTYVASLEKRAVSPWALPLAGAGLGAGVGAFKGFVDADREEDLKSTVIRNALLGAGIGGGAGVTLPLLGRLAPKAVDAAKRLLPAARGAADDFSSPVGGGFGGYIKGPPKFYQRFVSAPRASWNAVAKGSNIPQYLKRVLYGLAATKGVRSVPGLTAHTMREGLMGALPGPEDVEPAKGLIKGVKDTLNRIKSRKIGGSKGLDELWRAIGFTEDTVGAQAKNLPAAKQTVLDTLAKRHRPGIFGTKQVKAKGSGAAAAPRIGRKVLETVSSKHGPRQAGYLAERYWGTEGMLRRDLDEAITAGRKVLYSSQGAAKAVPRAAQNTVLGPKGKPTVVKAKPPPLQSVRKAPLSRVGRSSAAMRAGRQMSPLSKWTGRAAPIAFLAHAIARDVFNPTDKDWVEWAQRVSQ